MNIHQLTEEIRGILRESDHSLTPKLRKLFTEYAALANDLCQNIEECRKISLRLSLADAASHARKMSPPLAMRARALDFPERKEFLQLCALYQLEPTAEPDWEFLEELNSPLSDEAREIRELLRDWRKIARTGTTSQKMEVLRKIVATIPEEGKASWQKNLLETETKRYEEILQELANLQDPDAPETYELLEAMNREVHSPLLVQKPSPELLERLQERLLPLQKKHTAAALEEKQNEMLEAYSLRNNDRLQETLQQWENLLSNPLADPTPDQQQFAADVRKHLENERDLQKKQKLFAKLLEDLKKGMAKNAPYPDLLAIYNQLSLLDLPLPSNLKEDMERLGNEHNENEHRLNIRRMAYGTIIALFVLALTIAAILFIQHRNSISNATAKLNEFIQAGDFQSALDFYEKLKAENPRVASNPKVEPLQAEALNGLLRRNEEIKNARAEFQGIKENLLQEITGDFLGNQIVEERIRRLQEIRDELDDEGRKELAVLLAEAESRKKHLTKEHEDAFDARRKELFQEMDALLKDLPTILIEEAERRSAKCELDMELLKADSNIDPRLREVFEKNYQEKRESLDYAMAQEQKFRNIFSLILAPPSFPIYIQALAELKEYFPDRFPTPFERPLQDTKAWLEIQEDLQAINRYMANPLDNISPKTFLGKNFLQFIPEQNTAPIKNFADELLQNCDYFEIVARDADGQSYYFYSKNAPTMEACKENRSKIQYFLWDIDAYPSKKDCDITLKINYNAQGQRTSFENIEDHPRNKLQLPKKFVAVEGCVKAKKCGLYELALLYEDLESISTPQEEILMNLFQKCEEMKNPFNKFDATLQLLGTLEKILPLDRQEIKDTIKAIKTVDGLELRDWKKPDAAKNQRIALKNAQEILNKITYQQFFAKQNFRWEFLGKLYSRGLQPAGCVHFDQNGKPYVASFRKIPPKEYLVFQDEALHVVQSNLANGEITSEQDARILYDGQLLWAFDDDRKTEDFLKEWQAKGAEKHIPLAVVPTLCPQKLQYFLH